MRITMHNRVFERPLAIGKARDIVASWLERPQIHPVEAGPGFFGALSGLLVPAQVKGALVSDAALAPLAIEQGATLCTTDGFRALSRAQVAHPPARLTFSRL